MTSSAIMGPYTKSVRKISDCGAGEEGESATLDDAAMGGVRNWVAAGEHPPDGTHHSRLEPSNLRPLSLLHSCVGRREP